MSVTVRLFAILREQADIGTVEVAFAPGATAGSVARQAGELAGIGPLLADLPVAMAVNRVYAAHDTPVNDGDELALIPPVSGGATRIHAAIGEDPISLDVLVAAVRDPAAGAIVTFQGEPREVDALDYEAYLEMALPQLEHLLQQVLSMHGLVAIAAVHRTGRVPIGEASVAVAASAPHRPEAFAGARDAIDRIKAELPIWKRELSGQRSAWVAGSPRGRVPE